MPFFLASSLTHMVKADDASDDKVNEWKRKLKAEKKMSPVVSKDGFLPVSQYLAFLSSFFPTFFLILEHLQLLKSSFCIL